MVYLFECISKSVLLQVGSLIQRSWEVVKVGKREVQTAAFIIESIPLKLSN